MENYLFPIAAVFVGYFFVLILTPKQRTIKLLLAFSGAFLLSITIFHLLPDVYYQENSQHIGLFIMIGILLQIFLEFFSKGVEHGHVHIHKGQRNFPLIVFISLCIHAVIEGAPINEHPTLLYGIIIHKIPIAIILSTFCLNLKMNTLHTSLLLILFAVMTPLGSLLANIQGLKMYSGYLSALVIGIFLHIATTILFESSEGHKFNINKLAAILLGIITAYLL
ncbi:ZIP family metal transporter [Leptobacterium sp. I13]|uniref:ZIP family metal transporter n=1 Tax=Leptobacterium meishanense TaxID=3128904 RepID=UPI0030EEEA93